MIYEQPLFWAGLFVVGLVIGYIGRQFIAARQLSSLEQRLRSQTEEAHGRAKSIVLEAQERATSLLSEAKKEERESKMQLGRLEERLLKKEETLERLSGELKRREEGFGKEEERIASAQREVEEIKNRALKEAERISGLSSEEAKQFLFKDLERVYREDIARSLQKLERERKEELEKRSAEILTAAIQRFSRSHVTDVTTSSFQLQNEDLKGKIIGREGRNIRALERATGVEIIIDETPDTILISSFDPMRRELARMALEKLIKDGRIQPAKIEEKVEEARSELNKRVMEIGEAAAYELGIYDLPKELLQLVGRLNFRLSYGQNVLTHSIEAAHLAAMLAAELGANAMVAKKGALLHDIGKAIDHEVQGTHVEIGRMILKKYGVEDAVIKAMESHHEEYPFSTPEAFIVSAAESASAARPGARRDTLEQYVKRLEDLEKIALDFPGVQHAYAISAGRELRIFVIPEKIDDFAALQLARDIAGRIETELRYPGEIKVNVIREMRAVGYAR